MMYCTSFESPDIQFLGARRTEGVAFKQSHHAPSNENNHFIQMGVAALFGGPRPLSFWLRGTEYQGFHMRYHLLSNSDWLIIYRPKRQTENLPMPFYMSASVTFIFFNCKYVPVYLKEYKKLIV